MKKPVTVLSAVLISCIILFSGNAIAGMNAGAATISPMAGLYTFDGEQDLDTGVMLGLGFGYNITDNWAAEGVFNLINTEASVGRGGNSVECYLLRLDFLYHFRQSGDVVPYLAAGVGTAWFDAAPVTDDVSANINYGAGIKYFFMDNMAIRGEVRHIMAFDDYNTNQNFSFNLGLTFQLGK